MFKLKYIDGNIMTDEFIFLPVVGAQCVADTLIDLYRKVKQLLVMFKSPLSSVYLEKVIVGTELDDSIVK